MEEETKFIILFEIEYVIIKYVPHHLQKINLVRNIH